MAQNGTETGKPSFTARQKRTLPILASASSISEAARLSDVGRRTLHRWLDDPNFRNELAGLHKEAADLARSQLQGVMLQAVLALADSLQDPNPEIRLRAIRTALDYSVKFNDIETLRQEFQDLEDSLNLSGGRHNEH